MEYVFIGMAVFVIILFIEALFLASSREDK